MCPGNSDATAAMSVNMQWLITERSAKAAMVSCQVVETYPGSYYCCVGFNGGYMGIQDIVTKYGVRMTKVIFSLWDQAGPPSNQTVGHNVTVERFGGEGTGLKHYEDGQLWSLGEQVSCLVIALDGFYGAYYRRYGVWKLIATTYVPGAVRFTGFYSFVEDFLRNGSTAMNSRVAVFGPSWFMHESNRWVHAPACRFGASYNVKERADAVNTRPAGEGMRTLETGGDVELGPAQLEQIFKLAPGREGPPTSLPKFPSWFK